MANLSKDIFLQKLLMAVLFEVQKLKVTPVRGGTVDKVRCIRTEEYCVTVRK